MELLNSLCKELLTQDSNYCEILYTLQKRESLDLQHFASLSYENNFPIITINPQLLGGLNKEDQLTIIQHELLHYTNLHHSRRSDKDLTTWNIACDCAVNSLLNLSDYLKKILILPEQFDLPQGQTAEWYYESLLKQNICLQITNHSEWKSFNLTKVSTVSWSNLVKQHLRYSLVGKKISTNKRISRRFGTRPGKKRLKSPPKLLVALDVSNSMAESLPAFAEQIKLLAKEINLPATLLQFGQKIYSKEPLSSFVKANVINSEKTYLNPVLNEANSYSCCVILTDGLISDLELVKCTKPIIWVYTAAGNKVLYSGKHIWLN